MSDTNTFTLANLVTATKKKLGPTIFVISDDVEVELPSVFRLGKTTRDAVVKAMEDLDQLSDIGESDEDEAETAKLLVEAIADILRLITPSADTLLDAVKDDDPLITASVLGEILAKWMEHTQAGEA